MRILILILSLFALPAQAQLLVPLPSTADLSVSSSSTAEFSVRPTGNRPVRWFSLKNDCTDTLYFALTPNARTGSDYPLRLGPGETFTMAGRLHSFGASNDGSSDCTFTFQAAE